MAERIRQRRSWTPRLILLLIVAGVVYWLFFSGTKAPQNSRSQAPITITTVARKDVPVYLVGLGTIQAFNTVTVHSQVDGQLLSVLFNEGQTVKAGDVLAKIDPRTFKANYDQALANKAKDEATLANAKIDLTRYVALGNSVSGQTVDTQRATVKQLDATVKADQAAVDNTAAQLSYTTIASPINGRTGIRQVDTGNIVHSSDANGLVVITQLQPISVIFSLPQQSLQPINTQLNAGNTLQVQALGDDNKTVVDTGTLGLVDNEIDQTTGTIKLKANFPNASSMLWPGGFTNVRMLLTTKTNVVVVPTVAVQHGPQNAYVFIYHPAEDNYKPKPTGGDKTDAKSDDKSEDKKESHAEKKSHDDAGGEAEPKANVEMRTVTVDMTTDQDTVISDGVKEGEQVVIDGMSKLQDGSKVELAGQHKGKGDKGGKDAAADNDAKDVKDASDKTGGDKTDQKADEKKDTQDSSTDSQGENKHPHKQQQPN